MIMHTLLNDILQTLNLFQIIKGWRVDRVDMVLTTHLTVSMDKYFEMENPKAKDRYCETNGVFWYRHSWTSNMQRKSADPSRNARVGKSTRQ